MTSPPAWSQPSRLHLGKPLPQPRPTSFIQALSPGTPLRLAPMEPPGHAPHPCPGTGRAASFGLLRLFDHTCVQGHADTQVYVGRRCAKLYGCVNACRSIYIYYLLLNHLSSCNCKRNILESVQYLKMVVYVFCPVSSLLSFIAEG